MTKAEKAQLVNELTNNVVDNVLAAMDQKIQQGVQSAVEQAVQGSSQEKTSLISSENKFEETNTGEAHRGAVLSTTRVWNWNDKALNALELKEKELHIAEREMAMAHQRKLNAIEIKEAEDRSLVKHIANTNGLNFAIAAQHPFSPNGGEMEE